MDEHSMFVDFEKTVNEIGALQFEKACPACHQDPCACDDEEQEEAVEPHQGPITQEVVEFIQSMYDAQTGTFPRGEEGVKIACEKKFGEQAGQFAHYVVEKLSAKSQAGQTMQEQPAVAPVQADPMMDSLARIRELVKY
jgi:hypothetical protein